VCGLAFTVKEHGPSPRSPDDEVGQPVAIDVRYRGRRVTRNPQYESRIAYEPRRGGTAIITIQHHIPRVDADEKIKVAVAVQIG
jgi:hypothetical protein